MKINHQSLIEKLIRVPRSILGRLKRLIRSLLLRVLFGPIPISVRHHEFTLLKSIDTAVDLPNELIDLTISSVQVAKSLSLSDLDQRLIQHGLAVDSRLKINTWPGEHYRLLAAIAKVTEAKLIIEIGTFHGTGALAFKSGLAPGRGGKVITFDIIPWDLFDETLLEQSDFGEELVQIVGDLQDPIFFARNKEFFERADLIFMDAAKDGIMEQVFLNYFRSCKFLKDVILVIDDIHLWNMLKIWEGIDFAKLDISCFGHYTGTGLVLLNKFVNE